MKKPGLVAIVIVCCIFVSFLLGFYLGRNLNGSPIQITKLPQATANTAPIENQDTTGVIGIVNINTATLDELQTLPGIGPVLAQRIIDYREQHGPFTDPSQLTMVSGIGTERLNSILDFVTVGG